MPELPEVDHARALLEEHVLSKKVSRVEVIEDDTKVIQVQGGRSPKDLPRLLEGKVLKEVKRKGKYLWLNFGKSCWVLAHFGMTGSFVVRIPASAPSGALVRRLERTRADPHFATSQAQEGS